MVQETWLGIELGSTRIKACLIGSDHRTLATGSHAWENQFVDRRWTYALEDVWAGLRAAVADLLSTAERAGVDTSTISGLGISAMMHGYLAFDADDQLLVPFRTWRNTNTGPAAAELTDLFGTNIPLRWSIAHLHQAVIDTEPHLPQVSFVTTLAGYVHWQLTGRRVLGVGDASGMFPIDPATRQYDTAMVAAYRERTGLDVEQLFPAVLAAGADAGTLSAAGAALLDPTGVLTPGIPLAPPEGDAGTGMVATNSVAPRTGNVSAGTSIFAMVVLERPLSSVHHELDLVTTPAGHLVAMVHCNNGASELGAWVEVFRQFAAAAGHPLPADDVYATLFRTALDGDPDGGGLLAYNHLAGEPIAGLPEGRPMIVRTPDSTLSLANFARAQIAGVFGTLSLGMQVLAGEGVSIDAMFAHGGLFRTAEVAQRLLAAAIDAPVAVGETAGEGGAWGSAVLAAYRGQGAGVSLEDYLSHRVFADAQLHVINPDPVDLAGYRAYLERYRAGLAAERTAAEVL